MARWGKRLVQALVLLLMVVMALPVSAAGAGTPAVDQRAPSADKVRPAPQRKERKGTVESFTALGVAPAQGGGSVALMGDWNGQLTSMLQGMGFVVSTFAEGDYWSIINQLDQFQTVVLHRATNDAPALDELLRQASRQQKGLVFMGFGSNSGLTVYDWWVEPLWLNPWGGWSSESMMLDAQAAHPVLDGFGPGARVTYLNPTASGWAEALTFGQFSGARVATSAFGPLYGGSVIGVKDEQATGGARHVLLAGFGVSDMVPAGAWTQEGKQILANAIRWAGRMSSTPTQADVAVMGDVGNQLAGLLESQGFTVASYAGDDYGGVLRNLDSHRAVVLNRVSDDGGFDQLMAEAANLGKGVVLTGQYTFWEYGLGVWAARQRLALQGAGGAVSGQMSTHVENMHPIVDEFGYGANLVLHDTRGREWSEALTVPWFPGQALVSANINGAQGTVVGVMESGYALSRQVFMATFGVSERMPVSVWTEEARRLFGNAVRWAGDVQPAAGVAIMGDYNDQIGSLLRSRGYQVDSYAPTDYSGLIANLSRYRAVLLHKPANATDFDQLLSAIGKRGLIYLSTYPVGQSGIGLLSLKKGDPAQTGNYWGRGPVTMNITDPYHPLFMGIGSGAVVLINGGDNDYQTFDGFSGTMLGTSAMPGNFSGIVGVKDNAPFGGNRTVLLGSLGASAYTDAYDWTEAGRQLLFNAVEWASGAR